MTETYDVLIQADRETLTHKMKGEVAVGHVPYWRVSGTPRRTEPGRTVLFSDGERVIARGVIGDVEEGRIVFTPLEETDEELPDDPPSRGFKYVTDPEVPA